MRPLSGVVALAVVSAVLAGCSDDDSESPPESIPAPATSGPDSEHLLIHGAVTQGDEPVADARLSISVMQADQSDVEPGDTLEVFNPPHVETDDNGEYTIELDPDELPSTYFNGEYLNFDLSFSSDAGSGIWSTTVWLKRHEYWRSDGQALVGDAAMDISIDLEAPTITLTDSYGEADTQDLPLFP